MLAAPRHNDYRPGPGELAERSRDEAAGDAARPQPGGDPGASSSVAACQSPKPDGCRACAASMAGTAGKAGTGGAARRDLARPHIGRRAVITGVGEVTSAFCARCRSQWSMSTSASIASAIGVARRPTHGS
jgi:hypothetical protein